MCFTIFPPLSQKFKICYVDLVGTIDMPLGSFNFSNPFLPFTALKCGVLDGFSGIFSLFVVPRLTALQIELRNCGM